LPQTVPDRSRFVGTSEITVGGVYRGSHNSTLEYTFTGAGQIGVTEGLQLEVRNETGQILQTVNVGHGYSPGDAITLDNGITLNISSGTIVTDDAFSVEAVANADETGFLVALGMNTFFVGDSADTLAINSDILESTDRLATSLTGDPGDSENLTAMINRRVHTSAVLGHHTVEEFVGELISLVGADVQALTEATETLEVVGHNLEAQRAGLSGVDPDEEVVKMLQFQRAYEAAARYLNVVNETTIELLSII
jgi:flagellar hook-associated protein 1 FlgK